MKTQRVLKDTGENLRSYLGLRYHLVGVKLIKNSCDMKGAFQPKVPMAFCQVVRLASTSRNSFLYGLEYEKCSTAQVVLGFRDLKYGKTDRKVITPETRKVLISSLDEIGDAPEVVLAILTPKQMMDLTILLQAGKKSPLVAEFTGERACAEFFSKPFMEGKPNMSLLCDGAREIYSDFRDSEIVFGAPLKFYIEAAETIERITKMGGALCGCRTSDVPAAIIDEFEKIGFSKGTDYFFGRVNSRNIRVYLNKDLSGKLKSIAIHLPVKMPSEEAAERLAERLRELLSGPYFVDKRGYWLDLTVRASEDALAIDLFDGLSVKAAVERFVEKVTPYPSNVERIYSRGED